MKNGAAAAGPANQDERPLRTVAERFSDGRGLAGIGTLFKFLPSLSA
jgi:hypothetical protein